MQAIILAGGLGTRLRGAVPDLPKPMALIAGRPFLDYLLEYWRSRGVRRFILSVGYKWEYIHGFFGRRYKECDLFYSIEKEPLGTGGAARLATHFLTEEAPFLLVNGDTFFEVNLNDMLRFHDQRGAALTMALTSVGDCNRYGVIECDSKGRIQALDSDGQKSAGFINGGVYLINPGVLESSAGAASLERDVLPALLATGKACYGFVAPGKFVDIGIPEAYYGAAELLVDWTNKTADK